MVMPFDRWEHQWLRAWRWYERTVAESGRSSGHGRMDAEDFAEALAQSVWHLKDWLKNDEQQQTLSDQEIEQFANNEPVLKVLADLCNGSKYAKLATKAAPAENLIRAGRSRRMGGAEVDSGRSSRPVARLAIIAA